MATKEQIEAANELARMGQEMGTEFDAMPRSPAGYLPDGWYLNRINSSEIVVTHESGSGVVVQDDERTSLMNRLFYQLASDILEGR